MGGWGEGEGEGDASLIPIEDLHGSRTNSPMHPRWSGLGQDINFDGHKMELGSKIYDGRIEDLKGANWGSGGERAEVIEINPPVSVSPIQWGSGPSTLLLTAEF